MLAQWAVNSVRCLVSKGLPRSFSDAGFFRWRRTMNFSSLHALTTCMDKPVQRDVLLEVQGQN